jgi:hypothetical protein
MAMVAALVEQGHNRLRYLITTDVTGAASVTITTTGAASPDLLTDSLYGPVKQCARAFTNGLGILPAGALTQAQSRAIWLGDSSDTVLGNSKVPRCIADLTVRGGTAAWGVDVNVDGSGHPTLTVSANQTGSAYLDVLSQGAIGL